MAALLFSTPALTAASPAMGMSGQPKRCCMTKLCGSQLRGSQTCCAQVPGGDLQQTPNYSPTHPDIANLLLSVFGVRGIEEFELFATDFFGASNSPPGHCSILRI